MNELVNHPDWMPLLLDDNGEVHLKRKGKRKTIQIGGTFFGGRR